VSNGGAACHAESGRKRRERDIETEIRDCTNRRPNMRPPCVVHLSYLGPALLSIIPGIAPSGQCDRFSVVSAL